MSESQGDVLLERHGAIAHVVIANEARRNALNLSMWESLREVVQQIADDDGIRAVIVRGAGSKAFSAGADIKEFADLLKQPERLAYNNEMVQKAQLALEELSKPTIAQVTGACVGGGCGIALCCDFRFASPDASFGITPAKLGLLYSVPDTRRLHKLVGPTWTREMLYTGRILSASEAKAAGIVSRLVEADQLAETVNQFAAQLSANSSYSIGGIKATLSYLEGSERWSKAELEKMFDKAFESADFLEGRAAFLEKRAPVFNREEK